MACWQGLSQTVQCPTSPASTLPMRHTRPTVKTQVFSKNFKRVHDKIMFNCLHISRQALSGIKQSMFERCLSIHSGYFYSASSSPLLLRSVPDTARIGLLCLNVTPKRYNKQL